MGSGPDPLRQLALPGLLGHNPVYVEAFRGWLKDRYGSPTRLKDAWGSEAPSSFDRAEPPGADRIITSKHDPSQRYAGSQRRIADWLLFRAQALAEGQAWQGEVIERLAPHVVTAPLLSEFSIAGPLDPDGLAPDLMGKAGRGPVAISLTADAIPFPLLTHAQDVALTLARATGPARPLWLTDYAFRYTGLFGGSARQALLAVPYVAPYTLSAVLSGARGFFFKGWAGHPGQASLAYPGRRGAAAVALSDEGIEVAKVACLIKTIGPWLAGAELAAPRYGLLVSWPTLLFEDPDGHHPLALLNALALAGIHDAALVTERHLLQDFPLPYDVLFAPFVTRLTPAAVKALRTYVEQGGLLISDTYLASVREDGTPQQPLGGRLDEVFGVTLELSGTRYSDERTIGALPTEAFKERQPPMPISLSLYAGSYRVRPGTNTYVLANYAGGEPGEEVPAIAVHPYGKGRAVLIPRLRLWPGHLKRLIKTPITKPELRALKFGRSSMDSNGVFVALTLRSLLEHLHVLPRARLIRAPVSSEYLAQQARWAAAAGLSAKEIERSEAIVRATQTGLPFLRREEMESLKKDFHVDLDAFAPVRVSVLQGAAGGMLVAVINVGSFGRDGLLEIPPSSTAVDLSTGEGFPVRGTQVKLPLAPYQARLLALF